MFQVYHVGHCLSILTSKELKRLKNQHFIEPQDWASGDALVTKLCLTLATPWMKLLCLWDFPGQNTGQLGCHFPVSPALQKGFFATEPGNSHARELRTRQTNAPNIGETGEYRVLTSDSSKQKPHRNQSWGRKTRTVISELLEAQHEQL